MEMDNNDCINYYNYEIGLDSELLFFVSEFIKKHLKVNVMYSPDMLQELKEDLDSLRKKYSNKLLFGF